MIFDKKKKKKKSLSLLTMHFCSHIDRPFVVTVTELWLCDRENVCTLVFELATYKKLLNIAKYPLKVSKFVAWCFLKKSC